MVRRTYFEHANAGRGSKLSRKLRGAGYRGSTYAANLGYGSDYDATDIVAAWMDGPPDRTNILHRRLRFAGVGVATAVPVSPQRPGTTFTMQFGATLRQASRGAGEPHPMHERRASGRPCPGAETECFAVIRRRVASRRSRSVGL